MADFKKKQVFTTPVGTVEPYCYLHKADYGSGSFKREDRGQFKCVLTLDANDPATQRLMDEIIALHEASYGEKLAEFKENPPQAVRGKKVLQPYEGDMPFMDNGDGTVSFTFKAWDNYVKTNKDGTKETVKINIPFVDARGRKLQVTPAISGGSRLKLKFTMFAYGWSAVAGASVKLQLSSGMLVELVEFGQAQGDEWSDDVEEGGFSADDYQPRGDDSQPDPADDDYSDDDGQGGDF